MSQLRAVGAAILRRHGFFSIDQIVKATKLSYESCRKNVWLFCREGIIRQIKKGRKPHIPGWAPRFALIYRVIDRKKLAVRITPRQCENSIEDKMWFIIWNKYMNNGSFNLRDLTVLASAKRGTARCYLKTLRRAGYIVPSRSGGGPGVEWKLTQTFGCKKPILDRSRSDERR